MERDKARRTVEEELSRVRRLSESSAHSILAARFQDQIFFRAADTFLKANTAYLEVAGEL